MTRAGRRQVRRVPSRRTSLSVLTVVAASLALIAGPVSAQSAPRSATDPASRSAHEVASSLTVTGERVVTLVTGDRVRVTSYSDGHSSASLLPGSPHVGKPVRTVAAGPDEYVIPLLPVRVQRHLDASVFDVSKLRRTNGPVSVTVRFAAGATPHPVPGLTLDLAAAHPLPAGGTAVPATYTTGSTGLVATPASWRGVGRISLAGDGPAARRRDIPAGYRLHTLTVSVATGAGRPAPFELGFVVNVDDAALFVAPVYVVKGVAKVSVPEGDYAVFAGSFVKVVVAPDFPVTADTSITMNLADATTHPSESVPGRTIADDATVSLNRSSARRGGLTDTISFSGGFPLRVQPVPADLPHGTMESTVSATLAPAAEVRHHPRVYSSLSFVNDAAAGVPHSLSYSHPRSDFALVPQRFFGAGTNGRRYTYTGGFRATDSFLFLTGYLADVPGTRVIWLQADPQVTWDQGLDVVANYRTSQIAELDKYSRYTTPGEATPVTFAHGPVGPGLEARIDKNHVGPDCVLCRDGNLLRGSMPLFEGAGSGMFGALYSPAMGSWTLAGPHGTVGSGHGLIRPRITLPADRQRYRLTASSHPGVDSWQLSTRVDDTWRFTSRAGTTTVPLLIPSYLPATEMDGTLRPGATSFLLHFGTVGPADAFIKRAHVGLSTSDGSTWHAAHLTRVDKNTFRVAYQNPTAGSGRQFMSLRVSGVAGTGGTVEETAMRAYRLAAGPPARQGVVPARDTVAQQPEALGEAVPALGVHACPAPSRTRYSCYAVVMNTQRGHGIGPAGVPAGWGATDLRTAYDIPTTDSDETVAVVVAYDYPTAEQDLATYRRHFGLPPCTAATGCFRKLNQNGTSGSYPHPDPGWAVEAALDLQMVSAACPTCQIVLVEARQPSGKDLAAATNTAVKAGAVVTNHSYGIGEHTGIKPLEPAYNHPGVTAVTASGDEGYGPATFPAGSPHVIAVGGTVLHHAPGPRGWRENAWRYGGSGCSAYFAKPPFQHDKACGMRTYSDLAAVAYDVAVYDSFRTPRSWLQVAGTSISSPLVAGMIGAAGAGGIKPADLYAAPAKAFHDVRLGANGFCNGSYMCTSKPGYDGPTGLGTPRGLAAFGG